MIGIWGVSRLRPSHTTGRTGLHQGGSTALVLDGHIDSWKTERVEVVVAR